jgi:sugar lactone lactonase YvrE
MLLAYHPSNGSTIALMDKLWFGNGVALSPAEDYVLVADSIQMKIHRYTWHTPSDCVRLDPHKTRLNFIPQKN